MVDKSKYVEVGVITEEMAQIKNFSYPGKVYATPKSYKHIIKNHGKPRKNKTTLSKDVLEDLTGTMIEILKYPDYIGCDPSKEGDSLEIIKDLGDNILLALEFNIKESEIQVSSMYPISESKLNGRITNNRVKKWETSTI